MKFLCSAFFVLLIVVPNWAQTNTFENAACNPEYSQNLIQLQVSESITVAETERRIGIHLRAADFLWKLDQPIARSYFSEAFKIANERFAERGFGESRLKDGLYVRDPDYRFEVVRAIARKDSEWAKKLTELIMAEYEKTFKDRKNEDDKSREVEDLSRFAVENLKSNPNLSLFLFRRLMRYPPDHHWYYAFYSAAKENLSFADNLYKEALENYANQSPRLLLFFSAYPFGRERIFGFDKYSYGVSVPSNFTPNRNLQRQFLQTYLRRIKSFIENPDEINRPAEENRSPEIAFIVSSLQEIEPLVGQNFPDLLTQFLQTKAQVSGFLNDEVRKDIEENEKFARKFGLNFDQRLKIVEEANSEGKLSDRMIVELLFAAKTEDHYKKVERWLEKIRDEKARVNSINHAFFRRSKVAIEEKLFDAAARFADKVSEIEHRAILYFEIAEAQLNDELEAAKVSDLLNKVSEIADSAENSVEKAQVLLGLAQMYERVNHTAAISKLTEAVRVINQLENPDIFATTISRQIHVPYEISFYTVILTPGYNFERAFEIIGKNDFELALANARSLKDKYFRMIATLAVVKNCAEKKKKRKI